jgi:hypothetical protein
MQVAIPKASSNAVSKKRTDILVAPKNDILNGFKKTAARPKSGR